MGCRYPWRHGSASWKGLRRHYKDLVQAVRLSLSMNASEVEQTGMRMTPHNSLIFLSGELSAGVIRRFVEQSFSVNGTRPVLKGCSLRKSGRKGRKGKVGSRGEGGERGSEEGEEMKDARTGGKGGGKEEWKQKKKEKRKGRKGKKESGVERNFVENQELERLVEEEAELDRRTQKNLHVKAHKSKAELDQGGRDMQISTASGARTDDACQIKIGYIMWEVREIDVLYTLMTGLLQEHSMQAEAEIFLYTLTRRSPPAHLSWGKNIRMVSFSRTEGYRAAEMIREDGVDVLYDLTTYGDFTAAHILKHMPAPIQVWIIHACVRACVHSFVCWWVWV